MKRDWMKMGVAGVAIAAGLLGASAFQGPTDKYGIVDLSKVVSGSDFGKSTQDEYKKQQTAREKILQIIDQYRVLTAEQAQRLRDLGLKANRTAEENAEFDRIQADVIAASKKSTELQTKTNLTPEERTLLEEYARRSQVMEQVFSRWLQDFRKDLDDMRDNNNLAGLVKAREALKEVAKTDGYTIVYDSSVAPYGANDVTDEVLKAMNAKK